jgi:hypothetical protein
MAAFDPYGASQTATSGMFTISTGTFTNQDDGLGNIVNPSGLALRKQVFLHWGLMANYVKRPISFPPIPG